MEFPPPIWREITPAERAYLAWVLALEAERKDAENHARDLASEHFDLSWRDRDDG